MKLLLITYNYGGTASGIMSNRMALALANSGNNLVVICASLGYYKEHESVSVVVLPETMLWKKLLYYPVKGLIKILGGSPYNSNLEWRFRARNKAKVIIREWNPDFVYCRTTPIDPCYVGLYLKKALGCRVIQHFTDPIPPPQEYINGRFQNRLFSKIANEVLRCSDYVSFGNEYMMDYMLDYLRVPYRSSFFVSYDIAPRNELLYIPREKNQVINLVYLGTIYQSRNPQPLFQAIQSISNDGHHIRLIIYDGHSQHLSDSIEFRPYVNNTVEAMSMADVLVDLDGDDEKPVYISSKLKEYLPINRPILSITPSSSPSDHLLSGLITCKVVRNQTNCISEAIKELVSQSFTDDHFYERMRVLGKFAPEKVAGVFMEQVNKNNG